MIIDIDDTQAHAVLGAMKSVATAGSVGLSETDRRTIEAAGPIALGTKEVDVASLGETLPDQLASHLSSDRDADIATRMLAVMSLAGGVLDPQKTQRLRSFASALGIDEEYLGILDDATSGKIGRATDTLAQRGAEYFLPAQTHDPESDPVDALMPFGDSGTEAVLEERYKSLGRLPAGTFGRSLFDHFSENELSFPASQRGQAESFVIPHDSAHVIGGYSTHERDELLVAAFTAAMHPRKPMESQIVPAMFCWHLGIKLSWLGGSYRGAFEPDAFWTAWARGTSTRFDLFDPEWDFWSATEQPLEDVRRSLGVSDT